MQSGGGAGGAGWDPMNGPQPFSGYNYYAQQQEGAAGGHSVAGAQQQSSYFPGYANCRSRLSRWPYELLELPQSWLVAAHLLRMAVPQADARKAVKSGAHQ